MGRQRIIAVLEPRSATMKMGVHRDTLAPSLQGADAVVAELGAKGRVARSVDELVRALAASTSCGDQVLIMSNGGFGGLHGKLLEALAGRA